MSLIRQLDTSRKLSACFAIMLCLSIGLLLWMLGQLGHMSALSARADQKLSMAQASYASVRAWTWFFIAATIGVAGALAAWLQAEMARPLQQATEWVRRVSQGDLSTQVAPAGSGDGAVLLCSMQEMNDRLAGMIVKVRAGTESIAGSAGEIAALSMDLSARTDEQGASLEAMATSMARLTAMVKQSAGHAVQASELAGSVSEAAALGSDVVANMLGTMASINDVSRRIAQIIGDIDALAFQTNILALNAAVEAARAGDQGRGFAVVATEVRHLAQRSALAAHEIKLLIDESVEKVDAGTELVKRTGKTMRDVLVSVKRVTDIIGDIGAASAGHSAGIEQMSVAIGAMGKATSHNAALVQRSSAAAASMREQAGRLSRTSAAFSLGKNYAMPTPAIHLVSSNPNKLVRIAPERRVRAPQMHAVASNPAPQCAAPSAVPGTPVRSRGGAARRDLDWEEF